MAKKHSTKSDARRAARSREKLYTRIIGIGIVIFLATVITWLVIMAQKPNSEGGQNPIGGDSTPELIGTKQYSSAPPMQIDTSKQYFAHVRMENGGEFVIQLYPDKAPTTVNNFIFLARQGYFDGVRFHRVLEGFMAQTGDPTGTGSGGPGYSFANEANDLKFDREGVVAMANTGQPNSNGSQFFIMFRPYGLSESDYTIFGQVISGMNVVNAITLRDPTQNPSYPGDAIESISITEE
jgi:peptidylprolyl isomerase